MAKKEVERYESDPDDGFDRELVGDWADEKHARLRRYVDITWAARRTFGGWNRKSSYIDLYCGPGRARASNGEVIDGSAVLAVKEALTHYAFDEVHVGDFRPQNVEACKARLNAIGAVDVYDYVGTAEETVRRVVQRVDKRGLHLAFLDPWSVHAMPFSVIEAIASLKHADMLIHFSKMDFQRNLEAMSKNGKLEIFAPGWASVADSRRMGVDAFRAAIFSHWLGKIESLGYKVSRHIPGVSGPNNSELYWLVLVSRSDLANKFWQSVSHIQRQSGFGF